MPTLLTAEPRAQVARPLSSTATRVAAKQAIVAQLIAGQLSLWEAAARFRQAASAVSADAESVCRTLIGWVALALAERPEQADAVTERLECDLQERLERCGCVVLPEAL